MTGWPFGDLTPLRYGAIIADPPWAFRLYSDKGDKKSPQHHYDCMPLEAIRALPVGKLASRDCALFMWATAPMLDVQVGIMRDWGFTFKTAGAWAKRSKTGRATAFGGGYVLRSAAEFYLVGTIGRPAVLSRSVRNLIDAPLREHSRKPDQLHHDVEQLYEGPYAELFAREGRPGWDVWGNQTTKFDATTETEIGEAA